MTGADDRSLPQNLDAERSVLGSIMAYNPAFNSAAEILEPRDFYRDAHRLVYGAMIALSERNTAIDFVTLTEELGTRNELQKCGGPAYVSSLADGVPRATNVEFYARIVKEKATLRHLIYAANKILTNAYEADEPPEAVLDDAERLIFGVADGRMTDGFTAMDAIVQDNFSNMEALFENKRLVTGVPSGFVELDAMTRGFQAGDLVIIAGRPSMGKTSLVLNVAEHIAKDQAVGFFSLEMSKQQLFFRLLSSVSYIDSHRMMAGAIGQKDYARMAQALDQIGQMKLHVDDSSNLGVLAMRAKARRLKAQHGLSLLIVDYLQLMAPPGKFENRVLELGAISRSLKGLAKELGVPILALSQLSRAPEARKDHRPILSDLRESGALEQDADVVVFIYRDEVYNREPNNPDAGTAELLIAKARNGPTGMVRLAFIREQTRFANLAVQ